MPDGNLSEVFGAHRLSHRQRLVALFLVSLTTLILLLSVLYNYGMGRFEGESQSIFRSIRIVVETMTTTGFGSDSPWESDVMEAYVTVMQLLGVLIGFFTLRVLIIPLWKRTPTELDERLTPKDDHVVICEYRRDSDVLLDELERLDVEYVLIESDADEAKRLSDEGYQAIAGNPEDQDDLERASVDDANLVIADAGPRNASVLLSARSLNEGVRVVCLTESADEKRALEQIGVHRAISPHASVSRRLAQMAAVPFAPSTLSIDAGAGEVPAEGIALGDDVVMTELLIRRGSPLRGVPFGESTVGSHPDIEVVAGWFDGRLRLPPDPTDRITPNTVLVVTGPPAAIEDVREEVSGISAPNWHTDIIVVGMGEGGHAAVETLPDSADVTTVDRNPDDDVDVVGDVRDPDTLADAGIEDATALIVTVDDDASALLAVALARTLADDIEIFARITDDDAVSNAYVAGADYVLSIQRVIARLLASEVYGEKVLLPTGQIRTVRVDADALAGETLADADDREETDCRFVGVVSDGRFLTDDDTVIGDDDVLVVVGSDEAIQDFERDHA